MDTSTLSRLWWSFSTLSRCLRPACRGTFMSVRHKCRWPRVPAVDSQSHCFVFYQIPLSPSRWLEDGGQSFDLSEPTQQCVSVSVGHAVAVHGVAMSCPALRTLLTVLNCTSSYNCHLSLSVDCGPGQHAPNSSIAIRSCWGQPLQHARRWWDSSSDVTLILADQRL